MRQGEPLGLLLHVAKQEHVDVDGARAVPRAPEDAAHLELDDLARIEELLRAELGFHLHRGVQEVGLLEQLALRLGLVDGRRADNPRAVVRQQVPSALQVGQAVANIRAEAEITPHRALRGMRDRRSGVNVQFTTL